MRTPFTAFERKFSDAEGGRFFFNIFGAALPAPRRGAHG